MQTVTLDGSMIKDKTELHTQLAATLSFPAHYGNNLDALYDCLTDRREEISLEITGISALEANLGSSWQGFLRVFRDAQRENPHFRVVFH